MREVGRGERGRGGVGEAEVGRRWGVVGEWGGGGEGGDWGSWEKGRRGGWEGENSKSGPIIKYYLLQGVKPASQIIDVQFLVKKWIKTLKYC